MNQSKDLLKDYFQSKYKNWVLLVKAAKSVRTKDSRWMTLFVMMGGRKWWNLNRKLKLKKKKPSITTTLPVRTLFLLSVLKITFTVVTFPPNFENLKITYMDTIILARNTEPWKLNAAADNYLSVSNKMNVKINIWNSHFKGQVVVWA